ncbi:vomeronasal type-2 receptor 26-like [Rana temporaria]|uniref:vomeronasal type-2 receptor 26-like n=1 Tax=Rana temporaria TaxID=8407 RepID=UPI001AACBA4E|nr:vomeronasal type-2 receptor 26-like [Rana temporaria]
MMEYALTIKDLIDAKDERKNEQKWMNAKLADLEDRSRLNGIIIRRISETVQQSDLRRHSENCMKCPDEEWPNEKKDRCVPRVVEFLSYTDDPIVGVFSAVSILCCLLTGLILGIFIHYQDTPIVKANNRDLSFLLLVSIMLSFLCVFLFLDHPVDVTCMLRVTSFGVIFSVAVSSLLAKSIMDRDTHSYQGKIIIQCNEGSVIGFYSVLGYMGLLAALQIRQLNFRLDIEEYKSILVMIFAVDEINKDPDFLPNVTLGYHIFDTCGHPKRTLGCVLKILSGKTKEAPNYSCRRHGEVAGFIGDSSLHSSQAMAQLLSLYRYTQVGDWQLVFNLQIIYQVTDPLLSDRKLYPTLYRMTSNNRVFYAAIINCLLHFGWNWVGLVAPIDGSGDQEIEELSKMMSQHGICIEYTILFADHLDNTIEIMKNIQKSSAKVVIVIGHLSNFFFLFDKLQIIKENITLVLHESWNNIRYGLEFYFSAINCSLIFLWPQKLIPGVNAFINGVTSFTRPTDPIQEELLFYVFNCLTKNPTKNGFLESFQNVAAVNCTEELNIWSTLFGIQDRKPSLAYTSVYVLSNALHSLMEVKSEALMRGGTGIVAVATPVFKMESSEGSGSLFQNYSDSCLPGLRHFMKNIHYTDPTGEEIFFTNEGEVQSWLTLANWIIHKTGESYESAFQPLASFDDGKGVDEIFNINPEDIAWKGGRMPISRCNDRCPPGYRKAPKGSVHVCCYDCVPCSEGAVSNETDSDGCFQCPDEEWPDGKKIKCLPKTFDFLSYENDAMALTFLLTSLTFSAVTLFVLGNFIYYRDTPIVKANNRTVSFILLTAILLSFLCVFFFLGRPVDITCMLRQMSFGIFFSIAVACVLAKTIIVYIAFKATKPGSTWKKLVTVEVSNSLVLTCSSVQVLICVVWLSISPPFQEYDMDSYPGKILVQCNEGSVIGFYSMLGYMGFLAAVSFLLAFMVRTLPDSFNEAKYITFSMLVFCSVWIAMIPAYLSTRGKYMVAVEIFAILTSSAGILGCIFFPKCYIIIFKPELNTRRKTPHRK